MRAAWIILVTTIGLFLTGSQVALALDTVYQEPAEFLQDQLPGCRKQVLWLDQAAKARIANVTGRPFPGVRARYCERDGKTGWILDEIGKTEPITSGVIVAGGRVERLRVLIFRESRGAEVPRAGFTRQYRLASLDDKGRLDRRIDGITGATLSVAAVNRQVRLALLLDELVRSESNDH